MGIRIGIVGAGTTVAIADRHVEGFLAQEGRCTVAAVCSRTLEGCRRLCIRHGLDGVRMTTCLLYTSPSPRDVEESRMPSSA